MTRIQSLLLVLAGAVLPLAGSSPLPGQEPPSPDPAAPEPAKLKAWPKADRELARRVAALVGQFRKGDPELAEKATRDLVELGDRAAEMLMKQVTDREDNHDLNEAIFASLDGILDARHADLMAAECKKKKVELRRYLARRMCRFEDPDLRPALQALTKDDDEDTAFYGWLGLLAQRDVTALEPVLERCRGDWDAVAELVSTTLPAARSDELGRAIAEHIAKARPVVQAAGLKLMRYAATENQVAIVRNYLSAEDHNVKKEAVNAMRALHGMAPIEKLDVFKVIEMAKEWQSK